VLLEEGMRVDEGQLLARLDDATARRTLALAEAEAAAARTALVETEVQLRQARLDRDRARNLAAQGVSSAAALDSASAQADALAARLAWSRDRVTVADRQVAMARQDLADLEIRAPFPGVVVSKDAQPGEMISPVSAGGGFTRTGIGTLVDMGSLEIEVDVNESYIHRVQPSQQVTAVLDAYPEWRIPARVIAIVPAADREKATVKVRIAFALDQEGVPLDPRILPDMGVKVSFHAPELPGAAGAASAAPARLLLVPRAAVRGTDDEAVVLVVRDDRVERRAIGVGGSRGDEVEVRSGLAAGEQVVVEGPDSLQDGDRVVVRGEPG
jgi:RND family efflux transporter MFP subunit